MKHIVEQNRYCEIYYEDDEFGCSQNHLFWWF